MWINTYSKGASPNLLDPSDMMNLHMICLDSQTARKNKKILCLGLMREVKMKARLDQTLMKILKARLDQTLVMLEMMYNLFQVLWFMLDQTMNTWILMLLMSHRNLPHSNWMKGLLQRPIRSDKPLDADKNEETKVESMVNVPIQQDLSLISLMTLPIIDLTLRPESSKVHQQFKATTTDTTTTTTTTLPPPQAQQQSTVEAMMMKRITELEHIKANLIQVNKEMEERLEKHGARLYTLDRLDIPQQVSKAVSEVVTDAIDWAMQAPLCNRFRDLPKADMKEIIHQRKWETKSYKSHEDHMQLFEALKKLMNHDHSEELTQDLAEARKKNKKSCESPKTPPGSPPHQPPPPHPPAGPFEASRASGSSQVPPPPPLPSSTNQESQSKGSAAPSSSKTAASAKYQAWTTTDIRIRLSISMTPADLKMDEDMDLKMDEDMGPDEQAQSSNDEDIRSAHIAKVNLRQDWWKPFEEERPATPEPAWSIRSSDTGDIATFMDWFSKRRDITKLKPQDLEGLAFEIFKVFHPDGSRPALSISKIKATYYPDAGLEQMVPDQFWIEEECTYDIAT
nr:hypothetical protein [Tanacetum cinerariifolium]